MGTITGSPVARDNDAEPLVCETASHPNGDSSTLPDVLHALSDPVRLRIVAALSDGSELTCGAIDLPVVKSTCTHHFRVLREAGLIRQRIEGTTKLNSLRREELESRFPGCSTRYCAPARP